MNTLANFLGWCVIAVASMLAAGVVVIVIFVMFGADEATTKEAASWVMSMVISGWIVGSLFLKFGLRAVVEKRK